MLVIIECKEVIQASLNKRESGNILSGNKEIEREREWGVRV